jgi:hypothetical protein
MLLPCVLNKLAWSLSRRRQTSLQHYSSAPLGGVGLLERIVDSYLDALLSGVAS